MINGNRCKEARSPNKSRTRGKLKESGQNEGKEITHCCGNRAGSSSSSHPFGDKKTESEQTPVVPFEAFRDCTSNRTGKKQNNQSSPLSLCSSVSTVDPRGRHPPERRLLILGGPQSGKTSTANTILGDEVFDAGTETTHSNVGHTEMYGRRVTVVDTPPWAIPVDADDDTEENNNDNAGAESDNPPHPVPSLDSEGPCMGAILCPPGPHVILLVVSVTQPFTDIHRRAADEQLGALGGGTWRYSMVLFTGVDKLPKGVFIEEHISNTGEALQWLVERCGSRYVVIPPHVGKLCSNSLAISNSMTLGTVRQTT